MRSRVLRQWRHQGDETGGGGQNWCRRREIPRGVLGLLPQEIILSAESLKRYFYHFLNFDNLKLNLNRYRTPQHFSPSDLEKSQNRLLKQVASPSPLPGDAAGIATGLRPVSSIACDSLLTTTLLEVVNRFVAS